MLVALDASAVSPEMTGIGRYAQTLALTLPSRDNGRRYVLIAQNGNLPGAVDSSGKALSRIAVSDIPLWHQLALPGELEAWGADLYHSPLFTTPLVKVCSHVITIHDVIPLAAPEYCQPEFLCFFERWVEPCARLADRIVTVSEYSRSDILKHLSLPQQKVALVPECVSSSFRSRAADESFDAVLAKYNILPAFVLYAGSIEPRKNVDGIVAAYAQLPAGVRANLSLVIAGKQQPEGLDIEEMARRLGVRDRIVLAGYVPDQDLAVLYRAARMFVFPSRYEGFGLPVLEAMASGVPVIASTLASLPEIAGDAALLVDPDDIPGLSAMMQQLDEDEPLRCQLIERGLKRAEHFSPDEMVRRMTAVYDSVAEGV